VNASSSDAPDLSSRPFDLAVERTIPVAPGVIYELWTTGFDRWFAAPGTLEIRLEAGAPLFFEVRHEGMRYPHYGRVLRFEPNRLIEITWVTGPKGTRGAETVLTVELFPEDGGRTRLTLRQAGFPDAESRDHHAASWPFVLEQLEKKCAG